MKQFNTVWNEFIYGGHWGSLAASAIALSLSLLIDITITLPFLIIVYLGTQCIYSYNHHKELDKDEKSNLPRTNHLSKYIHNHSITTSIYAVLYIGLLVYFGDKLSIFFGGFLLLIGLFFTYKAKSFSMEITGFKTYYVAFSWALLPFFTAIFYSYNIDLAICLFSLFVFIRFFIDASFFDLKDVDVDKSQNLSTIILSFKNKKDFLNVLHVINILSCIPILLAVFLDILPFYSILLLFTLLYSVVYIHKGKNKNADILSLSYILVDGEYYYWPFLLMIGLYLF